MKKYILTATISVFSLCTAFAQDISSIFSNMPNDVMFELNADNKSKLTSKIADTTKVSIETPLGTIERIAANESYMALKTSKDGTLQIKLLPLINNSKIICVVKTVCGKACDSNIRFFTTDWTSLPGSLFPQKTGDWFLCETADKESEAFKNATAGLDMNPIKLTLSENDNTIVAEYEIESYLSKEDFEKIKPFISSSSKSFNWDKTSFK